MFRRLYDEFCKERWGLIEKVRLESYGFVREEIVRIEIGDISE